MSRFRSKLISEYGVGTKKKHMIYCGRGRPPKKALMNTSTEVQYTTMLMNTMYDGVHVQYHYVDEYNV